MDHCGIFGNNIDGEAASTAHENPIRTQGVAIISANSYLIEMPDSADFNYYGFEETINTFYATTVRFGG